MAEANQNYGAGRREQRPGGDQDAPRPRSKKRRRRRPIILTILIRIIQLIGTLILIERLKSFPCFQQVQ